VTCFHGLKNKEKITRAKSDNLNICKNKNKIKLQGLMREILCHEQTTFAMIKTKIKIKGLKTIEFVQGQNFHSKLL